MLDIGANIGVWSVVYSRILNPGAMVYAFEPQPKIFACLEKNIAMNGCANVVTYPFALSNQQQEWCMNASYGEKENFGAFRIVGDTDADTGIKISSRIGDTLPELRENIGFVKMDVEGHECEVLTGLKQTILANRPVMLIEIHANHEKAAQTWELIQSLGYKSVLRLTHCDYLFSFVDT